MCEDLLEAVVEAVVEMGGMVVDFVTDLLPGDSEEEKRSGGMQLSLVPVRR